MADQFDHVLANGHTFLAVTTGYYGSWIKATDPLTAIRRAAAADGCSSRRPIVVRCVYGKNDSLYVDDFGSISYSLESTVVPIGLFVVKPNSIKPLEKGQLNDKHESHDEWINKFNVELDAQRNAVKTKAA